MIGTRRDQHGPKGFDVLHPGEYGKLGDGHWYGCTPNGHACGFRLHQVVEHADGTITVSPSILVSRGDAQLYHGYLTHGVWSDA
jgi:hypothetical protein